jgi:ATPase subunit of ABC transporter with duplicated ATPase domains
MHLIVTGSDVSFEFPNGRTLFTGLNFSIESKLTALVGPNGVGKTSLAGLLTGELEPTKGVIRRHGAIILFAQRQPPAPVPVDEFLGLDYVWTAIGHELLAGIKPQTLCTHLSGGQWMRARLARALTDQFLILDEPTNDLDREGRDALLRFLRERPGGSLLISHDRECLQLCEEVFELSNRGLSKFGGDWSSYMEARELERDNLWQALQNAKRERDTTQTARIEQTARQEKRNRQGTKTASRGGMPKILIGARKRRAQTTTGKIDVSTLRRANDAVRAAHEAFAELKIDPTMYAELMGREIPEQKLIAETRGFNIRFQDWIYPKDLDLSWRGNVRIALKGGNGSGKSSLLKMIMGANFETRGEFRAGRVNTLYLDQRCDILDDTKSIFENVRDASLLSESEIRNGLAKFLFAKETVFQNVASLSGGERLRAALARGLLSTEKPELLILDEPTNNLDLANIEFLERLVAGFRGAVIIISHDEVFLKNCRATTEFWVSETG